MAELLCRMDDNSAKYRGLDTTLTLSPLIIMESRVYSDKPSDSGQNKIKPLQHAVVGFDWRNNNSERQLTCLSSTTTYSISSHHNNIFLFLSRAHLCHIITLFTVERIFVHLIETVNSIRKRIITSHKTTVICRVYQCSCLAISHFSTGHN